MGVRLSQLHFVYAPLFASRHAGNLQQEESLRDCCQCALRDVVRLKSTVATNECERLELGLGAFVCSQDKRNTRGIDGTRLRKTQVHQPSSCFLLRGAIYLFHVFCNDE